MNFKEIIDKIINNKIEQPYPLEFYTDILNNGITITREMYSSDDPLKNHFFEFFKGSNGDLCQFAAKMANLELLMYLHENNYSFGNNYNISIITSLPHSINEEVIRSELYRRFELDDKLQLDYFNCFKYVYENGCKIDKPWCYHHTDNLRIKEFLEDK